MQWRKLTVALILHLNWSNLSKNLRFITFVVIITSLALNGYLYYQQVKENFNCEKIYQENNKNFWIQYQASLLGYIVSFFLFILDFFFCYHPSNIYDGYNRYNRLDMDDNLIHA